MLTDLESFSVTRRERDYLASRPTPTMSIPSSHIICNATSAVDRKVNGEGEEVMHLG